MSEVRPTDLLGVWQLQRRLVDRRAGQFGHVTGWLELTLVGSVVHWLELGELEWDGQTFEVTRELHIIRSGDGWEVRFTDGRPFHDWRPGAVVEHPCGADLYRGLVWVDPRASAAAGAVGRHRSEQGPAHPDPVRAVTVAGGARPARPCRQPSRVRSRVAGASAAMRIGTPQSCRAR